MWIEASAAGGGSTVESAELMASGFEVRPLEPSDEELYPAFLAKVSARDHRLRFFSPAPLSARQIHRLTHYDPEEALVLVLVGRDDGQLYGVGRLHRIEGRQGEFGILVRSDMKGRGLGRLLLERLVARAGSIGVEQVVGIILPENSCMLALASELGFRLGPDPQDRALLRATLTLSPDAEGRRAA